MAVATKIINNETQPKPQIIFVGGVCRVEGVTEQKKREIKGAPMDLTIAEMNSRYDGRMKDTGPYNNPPS